MMGVPPSGSGYSPKGGAAKASPAKPIPNAALIERLSDEADLCRNEGADDIAALLDEASGGISALCGALEHILKGALSLPHFAESEGRAALAKVRGDGGVTCSGHCQSIFDNSGFHLDSCAALATGSRRAKTPQAVECEASQSGPKGNAQMAPSRPHPSGGGK